MALGPRSFLLFAFANTPPLCECIVSASRLKPACAGFFLSSRRLARVKFYLPEPLARWAATVEKAASGHLPSSGRRSEVKKNPAFQARLDRLSLGFYILLFEAAGRTTPRRTHHVRLSTRYSESYDSPGIQDGYLGRIGERDRERWRRPHLVISHAPDTSNGRVPKTPDPRAGRAAAGASPGFAARAVSGRVSCRVGGYRRR